MVGDEFAARARPFNCSVRYVKTHQTLVFILIDRIDCGTDPLAKLVRM